MNHAVLLAFCLVANLAVIGAVLLLIRNGLRRTDFSAGEQSRAWTACAVTLLSWYALLTVLGLQGVFAITVARVPMLPFGILPPIGLGLWLFLKSERLRAAAAALPLWWLVAIQVYRVIGVAFLFVWISGEMPAEAAIPAGGGDVLIGLFAIPAAVAVRSSINGAQSIAYIWNCLGILDFVTAIATGFLTLPARCSAWLSATRIQ
jgi:hypothetical protein